MTVRVPDRSIDIALGGMTRRRVGVVDLSVGASLVLPPSAAKGASGAANVYSGDGSLFIPGYDGNPNVGTLTPKENLPLWTGGNPDGQVVEGYKIVSGGYTFYNDTTLRNCWIYGGTSSGNEPSRNILARGTGHLVMEDCHVGAEGYYPDRHIYFADSGYGTIRRTYFEGGEDMLKFKTGCLFEQIQAGLLEPPPADPDPHGDNVQVESWNTGTGVEGYASILRYSNLPGKWYNPRPTIEATNTSAVIVKADNGAVDNVLLDNNFMDGGNMALHLVNADYTVTNMHVRNNIFGLTSRYAMLNINNGTVGTWTNNVDTTGTPVTIPAEKFT